MKVYSRIYFQCSGRSPLYSHINATFQGLSTVRVFNANKMLEKEFHAFQDHNTSSWFLFISSTRCFALWLDLFCLLFTASVTFSFLLLENGMYFNCMAAFVYELYKNHFLFNTRCSKWKRWIGDHK